jgi:o-succinylbenzoate---CoA ligase
MSSQIIHINNRGTSLEEVSQMGSNHLLPAWERDIYSFITEWYCGSDQIWQKTSGSTGDPKLIGLKKTAMQLSARRTLDYFGLKAGDTAWLCLPIDYIAGKMMVVRALEGNLNLLISEPQGTPTVPQQAICFTAMVPLQLANLLEKDMALSRIKKIIIGGAAVGFDLLQKVKQLPTLVYATYGMTETCSHVALQRLNGPNPDRGFHTLSGIHISANANDCLVIDAPGLLDGPIETSDRATLLSATCFVWLGRSDYIINTGGIKVSPEALEGLASTVLGHECFVFAVDDEKLGQKLALAIEKKNGFRSGETILSLLREKTEPLKCPRIVVFIDGFIRNENLKIDRLRTAELAREQIAG